ncbi:MAG TPA: hypothetical protein VMS08_03550 [Candidatus Saccharimonadia bacterium]|nr:hypothetical protein [Candidatus Saccharimonadia bacterium]
MSGVDPSALPYTDISSMNSFAPPELLEPRLNDDVIGNVPADPVLGEPLLLTFALDDAPLATPALSLQAAPVTMLSVLTPSDVKKYVVGLGLTEV